MTSESGVPELPSGWKLPMRADYRGIVDDSCIGSYAHVDDDFLAELVNAVYTPGGLRDRLAAAEEELARLKTAK